MTELVNSFFAYKHLKRLEIFAQIGFLLNCVVLSVFIAESLGNPLTPIAFNMETVLRLFSEYHVIFGFSILYLVNRAIVLFDGFFIAIINRLIFRWIYKKFLLAGKPLIDFLLNLHFLNFDGVVISKGLKFDHYTKMLLDFVKYNQRTRFYLTNSLHLLFSFILTYALIFQSKFPHAYFSTILVLMLAGYFVMILALAGSLRLSLVIIDVKQILTDAGIESNLPQFPVKGI